MIRDSESPVTSASHGDAQADIIGGGLITVVVLFLAMVVLVFVLSVLLVNLDKQAKEQTAKAERLEQTLEQVISMEMSGEEVQTFLQAHELVQELQEKLEQAEKEKDEATAWTERYREQIKETETALKRSQRETTEAESRAAQATRELEELRAKDKEAIKSFESGGMRLWVFRTPPSLITDAEPTPDGKYWMLRYSCKPKSGKLDTVEHNPDVKGNYLLIK